MAEDTSGNAVEVRIGRDRYETRVAAGGHEVTVDEPASLGGTDRGPTPYDLLLAALGACKAITLRMYADRKGWDLAGVIVRLRHGRRHARDCADCRSAEGYVHEITCELEVSGDLDAERRARLVEISERCPVQKTLSNEIKVRTTLRAPEGP